MPNKIAIITPNRSISGIHQALVEQIDPQKIERWPDIQDPDTVKLAVTWDHPTDIWDQFPNLDTILSLGAGADHLITDSTIPSHIRLGRIVTPSLKQQMAEFTLLHVLTIQRKIRAFRNAQKKAQWKPQAPWNKSDLPVGILGMGELGSAVAYLLHKHDFPVHGWSQSPKNIDGVNSHIGPDGLQNLAQSCRILICLLPLTNKTEGILNKRLFHSLPDSSWVIHVGRGEHLVESDLIDALDNDKLAYAYLDVFRQEPLPSDHAFWDHPKIQVTPHVASLTPPDEAAQQIISDYQHTINKQPLTYPVDREAGY